MDNTCTVRRVIVSLCAVLVTLSIHTPYVSAAASATQKEAAPVRIAIPVSNVAEDSDTASGYVNYTLDYLYAITQYTDWTYEVITVPGPYESGIRDAFEMLQTGEADIIAPLKYQETISEDIFFSRSSYATATTILQIPNKVFDGGDLGTEPRVAVVAQSNSRQYADEYFAKNHMKPQYLEYPSVEAQLQAVCSGEADVMLNSNLEYIPNMTVVAEFSPQMLYFASDDQELIQELDHALSHVNQTNPLFFSQLYDKYFINENQELTKEEEAFIRQAEPYVVAVLEDQAPYQYQNPETGEFQGISVELLRRIGAETGLEFQFRSVPSWEELLELLAAGEVQIVAGMPHDYDFALERNLTISRSFVSAPYMLVARTSFPGVCEGQRLALMEVNTYTDGYYVGDVLYFPTMTDCIAAVRTGKADYTYVDLYTAQFFLQDAAHSSLQVTSQAYAPRAVCFGLAKPTEHALLNILNKSINLISDCDMQSIISQSVIPPRSFTLTDFIFGYPVESILAVIAICLVVIGFLIFFYFKKVKLSKILEQMAIEDGLTGLYNSAACRNLVTEKLRTMDADQMGAFLLMDIDDFKDVNDRYGHQTGDQILAQFARILKDTMPQNSILARIGGDEFVVYLESATSHEEIGAICAGLRTNAHSIRMGQEHITISIGAATARKEDDFDALYRLADDQMYEAKRNSKDQYRQAPARSGSPLGSGTNQ